MIEHLFIFSSYVFILSDLKCYGSAASSFRNHFWKAKKKEKKKKKQEKNAF